MAKKGTHKGVVPGSPALLEPAGGEGPGGRVAHTCTWKVSPPLSQHIPVDDCV